MGYLMVLVGGVLLGSIITQVLFKRKTGYGYFRLEQDPETTGIYQILVSINTNTNLIDKKRIVLKRDNSPK